MESRDWLILKTLYEKRNITKTAEELYVTQPAMTKRLRQIENEFGVEIVKRNKHGVNFTPQGAYLAQCADRFLQELEKIHDHVENMRDEVEGTIRIGASNFITRHRLPALLGDFKRKYPKVNFLVKNGWSNDIFNMVASGDVQVAFVRGDYDWQNNKELYLEESICVISHKSITLEQLPYLPRIEYKKDYKLNETINNWWWGHFAISPRITMTVERSDICREMVREGLGYAILPSLVVENHEDIYKIDLRNKDGSIIKRQSWLFYNENDLTLKIVKAFVDFVKAQKTQ